jgi:hypothetical protein
MVHMHMAKRLKFPRPLVIAVQNLITRRRGNKALTFMDSTREMPGTNRHTWIWDAKEILDS